MKALVVVDMQKDFCYADGALYAGDHVKSIFEPLAELIKAARQNNIPVVFTQDWHREDDVEFRIWPAHCIAGSEGAEVIDELGAEDTDYFVKKRRYSAFFGTDLDLTLRELGVKKLYITGVLTNICVLHTAGDAVLRGYEVEVLKDCTAALNDHDFSYAIHHMENVFRVAISSSQDFMASLTSSSNP